MTGRACRMCWLSLWMASCWCKRSLGCFLGALLSGFCCSCLGLDGVAWVGWSAWDRGRRLGIKMVYLLQSRSPRVALALDVVALDAVDPDGRMEAAMARCRRVDTCLTITSHLQISMT